MEAAGDVFKSYYLFCPGPPLPFHSLSFLQSKHSMKFHCASLEPDGRCFQLYFYRYALKYSCSIVLVLLIHFPYTILILIHSPPYDISPLGLKSLNFICSHFRFSTPLDSPFHLMPVLDLKKLGLKIEACIGQVALKIILGSAPSIEKISY
jgi:hypothetical protein